MPIYVDSFGLPNGDQELTIHVLDSLSKPFTTDNEEQQPNKQFICLDSCMYLGTKNVTHLGENERKRALRAGQVYNGYFVRTMNGTYDYCFKIWTDRRLPVAPLNYPSPREDEVYDVIIIDKNEDYFGLACGPHLAFCRTKALQSVGVIVKNMSYPFGVIKATLRRVNENRPNEIPYAAFEATPVIVSEESAEDEEDEGHDEGDGDS